MTKTRKAARIATPEPLTIRTDQPDANGWAFCGVQTDDYGVSLKLTRPLGDGVGRQDMANPLVTASAMFLSAPDFTVGESAKGHGLLLTTDVASVEGLAKALLDAITHARASGVLPEAQQ